MEMTNNIQDLIVTIEGLRSQSYPDLSGTLVTQILEIEARFLEMQPEASKRIAQLVETYLSEEKK